MSFEKFRPWLLWLTCFIRRARPILHYGKGCRFERSHILRLGKRSQVSLGEKVILRSGSVVDVASQASLKLGDKAEVRHYAIIECGASVSIGRRSVIGAHNWLQGSGGIAIGDDVIIGPGVRIISTTHDISDPDRPFSIQPLIAQPVSIGSNVWIGADVIILGGVKVGNNVVIGAGALVNRDLPANAIYIGSPVRQLKELRSNL